MSKYYEKKGWNKGRRKDGQKDEAGGELKEEKPNTEKRLVSAIANLFPN